MWLLGRKPFLDAHKKCHSAHVHSNRKAYLGIKLWNVVANFPAVVVVALREEREPVRQIQFVFQHICVRVSYDGVV